MYGKDRAASRASGRNGPVEESSRKPEGPAGQGSGQRADLWKDTFRGAGSHRGAVQAPAGLQVQLCCAGRQVGRLKEEGSEVRARRPEADTTGEKGGSGPPGRTVSADGREAS